MFTGHRLDAGPLSLYYQIKQQVRHSIESGELPPGTPLPSERELCELYGVSRPTVRQAMQELLNEGLLERRRGVGTYVAQPRVRQRLGSVQGFSERMEREGRRPSTRLIEKSVLPAAEAGDNLPEDLQIPPAAQMLRLVRLRLADDEPILLETVHLPLERFPGLETADLENESLYRALRERYGVEIRYLSETLEPVLPSEREAELLQARADRPAMLASIATYDQGRRPVEHTLSLGRGDRCQYYIEFGAGERDGDATAHLRQTQLEVLFSI